MANFGERIAYWYLRLNGFLLIEDFVLHREGRAHTSDADLLAVRLPHSVERIGGLPLEPDERLLGQLGGFRTPCALIVQVKTGTRLQTDELFQEGHTRYALSFIGCFAPEALEEAVARLETQASIELAGWTVAKLLVSSGDGADASLQCPLEYALDFVRARLRAHAVRKAADRMFFPDELMQFFAWEAGLMHD